MSRKRTLENQSIGNRLQVIFGHRLKQIRRSGPNKCVQEDLAKPLGVSRTTVSNIERGRHRLFLDQVYIAARELGVGVEDLLPALAEVFPEASISTAPDVSFDPRTAKAAAEVAKAVSEQLASGSSKVAKTLRRR